MNKNNVDDILSKTEEVTNIKLIAQIQLMSFLSSMINKAEEEDEILREANKQLMKRLKDETQDLSLSALIRIIELKEKHKTEISTPLLKILESAVKPQPQEKESSNNSGSSGSGISQDDYKNAKKSLESLYRIEKIMDKIGKIEGVKE